jgi:formate hydrogenlyase subunit 4
MKIIQILFQATFFITVAPFLSGLITKLKNNFRMRQGQSVFQPYYNLVKLFNKGEVVSETASWIFKVTPYIVIASALTVALLIPVLFLPNPLSWAGDFLAVIFILALGRFFMTLAALDTASAFGGMGASREVFISSLVEPALCLVVFSVFLQFGSTNIFVFSGVHGVSISSLVAAIALFLVVITETSRIPVDNQETHLELTMVHEAMALEYSGRRLALIEMALHIKQMAWFFLIAQLIFPITALSAVNSSGVFSWVLWYLARIFIILCTVALVEVLVAKMRLFRVADFLGFIFVLGTIATICAILGV